MKTTNKNARQNVADEFPGYPYYPDSDDIYSNEIEVKDFDSHDLDKIMRDAEEVDTQRTNVKTSNYINEIVSRE